MADKIFVEVSARHLHVTKEDLETLFGPGAQLHYIRELSQPGEYLCEERVDVIGPKNTIARVSILGPCRPVTQIEVSATDARSLGIAAHVRASGDIKGSGAVKLRGPEGEVELDEGVIVAKRHIHTIPEDAEKFGVADGDVVGVKINTPDRSLIFGDVVVRVSPKFSTAMHIDTDESNAAGAAGELWGEIVKL